MLSKPHRHNNQRYPGERRSSAYSRRNLQTLDTLAESGGLSVRSSDTMEMLDYLNRVVKVKR